MVPLRPFLLKLVTLRPAPALKNSARRGARRFQTGQVGGPTRASRGGVPISVPGAAVASKTLRRLTACSSYREASITASRAAVCDVFHGSTGKPLPLSYALTEQRRQGHVVYAKDKDKAGAGEAARVTSACHMRVGPPCEIPG